MRILIIDTGIALPLVQRLVQDGVEIVYWINWIRPHPEPSELLYGKGIFEDWDVEVVSNFNPYVDEVDLIVYGDIGFGEDIDFFKERGKKVFGAGKAIELLENDRGVCKDLLKSKGIKIPRTWQFKDIKEAISWLEKQEKGAFVIKVNTVGDSKVKTFVSREKDDALDHLHFIEEKIGETTLIIEEKVEGVEMAVSAFFNGRNWLMPICVNFEHKKLMPGEVGEMTGEMGTVLYWTDRDTRLFDEVLAPLEDFMREQNFTGIFDLNCIVNEEGAFVLEATPRFGYPTIAIMAPLFANLAEVLSRVANGLEIDDLVVKDVFSVGVCLNVPEFLADSSIRVFGIEDKNPEGIYFMALWKEKDRYFSVPGNVRLITCVGTGEYLSDAMEAAYSKVDSIWFKDMRYRDDIGERLFSERELLYNWGYIGEETFGRME